MERRNNYAISAQNAKKLFLSYDQQALIGKLGLRWDERYLYTAFLGAPYRIDRSTGDLERKKGETWVDGNSFDEVLSIFDLVCDSAQLRTPAHRFRNMTDFGLQFHRELMESRDPLAEFADGQPEEFTRRVLAMGGRAIPGADLAFALPVFDTLELALFFWAGDEEFAPRLRYLWDENALQYIRYETMYYALGALRTRLAEN